MKKFLRSMLLVWAAAAILAPAARAQSAGSATNDVGDLDRAAEAGLGTTALARPVVDPLLEEPPVPMAGPVDPKIYRLGPGDLLQIQLWGRTSRSWLRRVDPEGYMLVPGSGSLRVDGRTLADVRTDVLKRLQAQFHGVGMDVRLGRPRTFRVYMTGQVRVPGPLLATGAGRVGDALAGGALADNGSRRRIEVQHVDGTRDVADLDLFLLTGDQTYNPWLRDGDVINVPVASDFIWAQGAVGRPGRYELGPNDSLLTLFRLAGDPIPAAAIDNALLIKWKDPVTPESLWVRLDDVYARRTNPALKEGDRLYVYYLPQYHLQHEAYIFGEVARPGGYPVVEGVHRLSDLVTACGGFLRTADLTAIRVHRHNPAAGEKDQELDRLLRLSREQLTASEYDKLTTKLASLREDYRVDWTRLSDAPRELDLLLRDGDVVRVERLVSSIRIDGEVKRPGILTFRAGLRISDCISQAGGFTDRAWRSRIRVTRAVTGQTLPAKNVRALDPGDFIWVPERPDKSPWDYARETLVALAQVATIVIAVRGVK